MDLAIPFCPSEDQCKNYLHNLSVSSHNFGIWILPNQVVKNCIVILFLIFSNFVSSLQTGSSEQFIFQDGQVV
jgi:hypothetical protein